VLVYFNKTVVFVQVFYNNSDVKQVDVPSFSGSFGILPSHVPLIAVLKPGVLTVHEPDGSNKRYFGMYVGYAEFHGKFTMVNLQLVSITCFLVTQQLG